MRKNSIVMMTEKHPLQPFLPQNSKALFLGSFPPSRERWSMEFYYPNFQNDMWRIFGLVFFDDAKHFEVDGKKVFDRTKIIDFATSIGIAFYDTAAEVIRTKGTASDSDLKVVKQTDIKSLLRQLPECKSIVCTGGKSSELCAEYFGIAQPKVGKRVGFEVDGKAISLFRMPSSSRAYPLKLEKKAQAYAKLFEQINLTCN